MSTVTQLAAEQLHLREFEEQPSRATELGTLVLSIKHDTESYEIFVVEENEEAPSLQEAASLAGFYNARFFHEYAQMRKIDVSIDDLRVSFTIEDGQKTLALFGVNQRAGFILPELSLEHLNQVADQLAKLHAASSCNEEQQFCQTVAENYQVVDNYTTSILNEKVANIQNILPKYAAFFKSMEHLVPKVQQLLAHEIEEERSPCQVLCHGALTAESLRFSQNNKLEAIVDWQHVHFGNPAEDLSNLIISSASTSIRRNHFMKVFRTYFYTLIDLRPQVFKLGNLKTSFRNAHRDAVLRRYITLLDELESELPKEVKQTCALRWEESLDDAIAFITGDYISDEEQCFFAK